MDYSSYSSTSANPNVSPVTMFFWLIFLIVAIVGLWKTFEKAKRPGWGAIIPFYNIYLMLKIAGKPGWWLILYFIPIVNIIIQIIVSINFAKAFGRSSVFGIFLIWLLLPIGAMIIGFGKSTYKGATTTASPVKASSK